MHYSHPSTLSSLSFPFSWNWEWRKKILWQRFGRRREKCVLVSGLLKFSMCQSKNYKLPFGWTKRFLFPFAVSNFRGFLAGKGENFSQVRPMPSGLILSPHSWFSHDVTKSQTKKLSLLLSFYFHVILDHLKNFIQTNFQTNFCFAIQDAWISRLLRDAAFSWRPGKLFCGLKTWRIFGDFAI